MLMFHERADKAARQRRRRDRLSFGFQIPMWIGVRERKEGTPRAIGGASQLRGRYNDGCHSTQRLHR